MPVNKGDDLGRLVPLLTDESRSTWQRVLEHPDAPVWNARVGDRVNAEDLGAVDELRAHLSSSRERRQTTASPPSETAATPPAAVIEIVTHALRSVPLLRDRAPPGLDLTHEWHDVPLTSRDDLATRAELLVPDDADLSRVIVHSTSGTSGHAVVVPMTPQALALSHALLEDVLAAHGVPFEPGPDEISVMHLCARRDTYVFATVFSVWKGAPFVKLNLRDDAWAGGRDAARRFARAWPSTVVSGDPAAFGEALAWEMPIAPRAFVSSALALEPALAARLTWVYDAQVIDWYSLTETGPIAASAPDGNGLMVLAPDLYVEAIGPNGGPVADGARGELVVSGGRNPCLPLVRYRTGDTGRIERLRCADGSTETRILDLEGRNPVLFVDDTGASLASVDLTRVLRAAAAFAQHSIHQRADGSVDVRLRAIPGVAVDTTACEQALRAVLGRGIDVRATVDEALGRDGKLRAYRSDVVVAGRVDPSSPPAR